MRKARFGCVSNSDDDDDEVESGCERSERKEVRRAALRRVSVVRAWFSWRVAWSLRRRRRRSCALSWFWGGEDEDTGESGGRVRSCCHGGCQFVVSSGKVATSCACASLPAARAERGREEQKTNLIMTQSNPPLTTPHIKNVPQQIDLQFVEVAVHTALQQRFQLMHAVFHLDLLLRKQRVACLGVELGLREQRRVWRCCGGGLCGVTGFCEAERGGGRRGEAFFYCCDGAVDELVDRIDYVVD